MYPLIAAGPDDGDLVLLLHGFPQTKEAWRPVMARLADHGLRAVAFDQRGYAPSTGGDVTLPVLADDAVAMADELGADRFHVVGHDWGGAVAWQLAASRPERVTTATVVATPHPSAFARSLLGTQALRSLYAAFFQLPAVPELVLRAGGGAVLRRGLLRSGLDAEHADAYTRAMLRDGVLSGALSWYRANARTIGGVGPAKVPTLYVWPSADVALGRAAAERTARHVEAPYRFEVLDGCPHWVPELRPAELAALVVEHIRQPEGSPR